jgi:hypothetical protein
LREGENDRRGQPVEGRCANHFELAYTESEFLLDFGQAYDPGEPLIHTRVIMTRISAKVFIGMMQELVRQSEQTPPRPSGGQE